MAYTTNHVVGLREELHSRFDRLIDAFPVLKYRQDVCTVDGSKMRLAVDDFKAILAEVRRLK
jgi:hypothetical protein